ncbi:MAG: transporter [Massilia sp.]
MPRFIARNTLRVRTASLLAAGVVGLAHTAVQAGEDDEIVTDRPDFVESSQVVGRGRFQVETSVLVERDRNAAARERSLSTPTLLRFGLGESFELRLETDGRTVVHTTELPAGARSTAASYADTSLGIKWHVLDEHGATPSVGVLLHADLPSGSRGFGGQGVRPSLRVAAEWELPGEMSLGLMPGVGVEHNEAGAHYSYGIFGAVLGKSFNERSRGFVELAAPQVARAGNGGTVATFDIGGAYLLSPSCQVDTMLSRGLNNRTPDWSWTVGLSFKL